MKETKLIKLLDKIKQEYQCEGVKVYYEDSEHYCIKMINDGVVVDHIRKGGRHKAWDLKKNNTNS